MATPFKVSIDDKGLISIYGFTEQQAVVLDYALSGRVPSPDELDARLELRVAIRKAWNKHARPQGTTGADILEILGRLRVQTDDAKAIAQAQARD